MSARRTGRSVSTRESLIPVSCKGQALIFPTRSAFLLSSDSSIPFLPLSGDLPFSGKQKQPRFRRPCQTVVPAHSAALAVPVRPLCLPFCRASRPCQTVCLPFCRACPSLPDRCACHSAALAVPVRPLRLPFCRAHRSCQTVVLCLAVFITLPRPPCRAKALRAFRPGFSARREAPPFTPRKTAWDG